MDWVIVLAAGRGVRAGGPKALHQLGGRAWWQVQEERLACAGLPVMWVVSQRVLAGIEAEGARPQSCVLADEMAPMFASVAAGCAEIARREAAPSGVFVLPVDVPAPTADVFTTLAAAQANTAAAIPTFNGAHGHPVYLRWRFAATRVLQAAADARLDRLIGEDRVEVEVGDAGVLENLNTAAEFAAWGRRTGLV